MTRVLAILAAVVLAACTQLQPSYAPPMPGDESSAHRCARDGDCVLVASSCCECPSFAVNVDSDKGCPDVECGGGEPRQCPAREARCDEGVCALACRREVCAASCPDGFAIDADGCLSCACALPRTECVEAAECVRTRADCCGCALGGADTAVAAELRVEHERMLMCGPQPFCPGRPTDGEESCSAAVEPACVQGGCTLAPPMPPAGACGRPDLPACPGGLVCVINDFGPASAHGVGFCLDPAVAGL